MENTPRGARRADRRFELAGALVIAMLVSLFTSSASGVSQEEWAEKAKAAQARRARVVTQEEREAAAARMRLQKAALPEGQAGLRALAVAVPEPGGIPDYFGSPNWAFSPPLRKFVDTLPGLGESNANNLGQFIPVAHPDTVTYPGSDYYEITLRQFSEKMHSDLPPTTLRGYVQTNMGTDANGENTVRPDPIHQLGPFIVARKDRPVRIKFINDLPTGEAGDLFIPVDETVMGAGMGPLMHMTGDYPMNYSQNRATLHLHGGVTPWISDGTPHQWITPADEYTAYPKGVSVHNVPDMPDPGPGAMTFFYTNQQSARLMFYHDHSYGITRLNVYAGEAAGYAIEDGTTDRLVSTGAIPGAGDTIPLIVQDKSFVDTATVRVTDPTWNWGTGTPDTNGVRPPVQGDLWYPHVYSPAQNPADLSGMNAYGRWHYGPWFWPPTTGIKHPPMPNPYYDPINAPWQNDTIPAAPNPSMAGEAFMDTAIVNGTAFPSVTLSPKSYRLRILNASTDRFWNLQMYVADPATTSADGRTLTEVKMVPAAETTGFPETWPTDGREGGVPDPRTVGPAWIQIANEGGLLPKPAIIPQQPVTWNMDPTTFNFGNVDLHSLLLGPAERADVIVDLSQYAGKTLIVYNDAPAAFPALDPRLDYYTNAPDLTDTGGYSGSKVGFGPNTRTLMRITVAPTTPAAPFDLTRLNAEFVTTGVKDGAFKESQYPIPIPDARYNEAYNGTFTADPYARIYETSATIETLAGTTMSVPFQPKAIQDEMGEAFDKEYGRMEGKLGLQLPQPTLNQTFVLQGFIDPATEIVVPEMTPMSPVAGDGTQIWKITHNGVDTHPIHFHLFDVQVLNRVGWDNGVRPPDDNELGWKETVRVSPLEDTIVALRPILPKTPFGMPESVRPLDPTMPLGSMMGFTNINPTTGEPLPAPTLNVLTNFAWEYVWHCHILSHEEMDMMRPMMASVISTLPAAPTGITVGQGPGCATISWEDITPAGPLATWGNPANEVGFALERALLDGGGAPGPYSVVATVPANSTWYHDASALDTELYSYRVAAFNAAGAATSTASVADTSVAPSAPLGLTAVAVTTSAVDLDWAPPSVGIATSYTVERGLAVGGPFDTVGVVSDASQWQDTGLVSGTTYFYRVWSENPLRGRSSVAATASVTTLVRPLAPIGVTAVGISTSQIDVSWTDPVGGADSFLIESAASAGGPFSHIATVSAGNTYHDTGLSAGTLRYYRVWSYRIGAGTSSTYGSDSATSLSHTTVCALTSGSVIGGSYGSTVSVAGTLKVGSLGVAGVPVVLQSSSNGSTFVDADTTMTAGGGTFSFAPNVYSKTWYRVRFAGNSTHMPSTSGTIYALPKARVGNPVAPSSMSRLRYYTVYAHLAPRHTAGTYPLRIYKYRYVSGAWRSYGYVSAKAYNYYSYTKCLASIRLPYAGRWRLSAYAPADSGHVGTWSAGYDYVTVW